MEFSSNNAIFLQIAERICDEILAGVYEAGDRLPSVREYAAKVEVNTNTTMRSYDNLAQRGIIFNKRGIGFFVSPEGKELIIAERRKSFLGGELPGIFRKLHYMDISPDNLAEMYKDFLTTLSASNK